MSDNFDFVIVGSGTAAGILAWRLGEAGYTVCVLEAGPSDRNLFIHVPAGFSKTLFNPKVTWQLKSDPNPAIANRSILYAQGKTLGGSSAINGMVYNRGQAADFDGWAQAGNPGWGYSDILPYFRKTEQRVGQHIDPQYRGTQGRLRVITAQWPNKLEDAFIEAAMNCGHPLNPDYNGAEQEGVGQYQSAIWHGWRVSTASAFLRPAAKKFNVEIRTGALAYRLLMDNNKVIGVAYLSKGATQSVFAKREVIVSAGAVNSPKLLQLSGIGQADLLKRNGIEVRHHLPGVGENLRDHYSPRIVAKARKGIDSINLHVKGLPLLRQICRWAAGRSSILACSPARLHVFGKSHQARDNPDFSIMFTPASFKAGLVGVLDNFPGMTCGVWQMRPQSSGYVHIASPDPAVPPRLNARYLSDPLDRSIVVSALREARKILAMDPIAKLLEMELLPGNDCVSDDDLLDFARNFGSTSYHLVGTCKMGPVEDKNAVVDARLRVHGIKALRVVDASIMPMIPSANTAASTMMIAEKASAMIIEDSARS